VSGNTVSCSGAACNASGGGFLLPFDTLTLTNSTVTGNTASCSGTGCGAAGGGLTNRSDATLTLTNSTVSGNTVSCSGASCATQGGGLINVSGTVTLQNTIVAKQLAGPDCAGTITSNGFNLDSDNTCQLTQPSDKPNVSNPLLGPLQDNGGPTQTHALLPGSPAIDAVTSGCPPPATDQRGVARPQGAACDIGAFEFGAGAPATLTNLSTRALVQTDANVMIAGVTIGGDVAQRVLVRGVGPTLGLPPFNVSGALADPVLQVFPQGQIVPIAQSDNWMVLDPLCLPPAQTCEGPAAITATGLAPPQPQEAAVLLTLPPGAYTAIVSGVGGTMGVGLVEVFEVEDLSAARLTNISTRGRVETSDNVMIAGVIIGGDTPKTVLVRAIGPSLADFGVSGVLADPTLQLFSGQTAIAENNNWQIALPLCQQSGHTCGDASAITATGLAPTQPLEAAILITLPPGPYTAIVSGVEGTTGVGLVEVFEVP
jgi:hypothetical protein